MGRSVHCTPEERRIVKNLREQGKTLDFIAEALGRSQHFVRNALKWKPSVETRGRMRKTTSTTDSRIVLLAKKQPFLSSKAISEQIGNAVSASTVRRRLLEKKLPGRIARKVPFLSSKNKSARKLFATKYKDCTVDDFKNILWSDETKINLFGSDSRRNVRRPSGKELDDRYTRKTVKHGGGNIMIWGAFSWNGVGPIYQITETMNKEIYRDLLQEVMLPYATNHMAPGWIFQQDNDPKHSSRLVKSWLSDNEVSVMEWPSQSPDLNPIENLWMELKRSLDGKTFRNKNQLWEEVKARWEAIPIEKCRTLIQSMPKRIQAVLRNKGGHSGY